MASRGAWLELDRRGSAALLGLLLFLQSHLGFAASAHHSHTLSLQHPVFFACQPATACSRCLESRRPQERADTSSLRSSLCCRWVRLCPPASALHCRPGTAGALRRPRLGALARTSSGRARTCDLPKLLYVQALASTCKLIACALQARRSGRSAAAWAPRLRLQKPRMRPGRRWPARAAAAASASPLTTTSAPRPGRCRTTQVRLSAAVPSAPVCEARKQACFGKFIILLPSVLS